MTGDGQMYDTVAWKSVAIEKVGDPVIPRDEGKMSKRRQHETESKS